MLGYLFSSCSSPCTSIKAGSLLSCEGGECVVPTQVILDSLLSGVPSTLNSFVRKSDPDVPVLTDSSNTAILRSLTGVVPFTNQFIKEATAVQFSRTLWLSVIFTDCGGTTIPIEEINNTLQLIIYCYTHELLVSEMSRNCGTESRLLELTTRAAACWVLISPEGSQAELQRSVNLFESVLMNPFL